MFRVARYTNDNYVHKKRPYDKDKIVLKLEDIAEYSPLDNKVEEPNAEEPALKKFQKSITEVGDTKRRMFRNQHCYYC